eukprot:9297240-Alexandrium_andersonii.AAC.2
MLACASRGSETISHAKTKRQRLSSAAKTRRAACSNWRPSGFPPSQKEALRKERCALKRRRCRWSRRAKRPRAKNAPKRFAEHDRGKIGPLSIRRITSTARSTPRRAPHPQRRRRPRPW